MSERVLEFGDFLPDYAALDNPGLTVCENLIPTTDGYESHRSPRSFYSISEIGPWIGSTWIANDQNERIHIGGRVEGIYQFTRLGFTKYIGDNNEWYNPASNWEFAKFGDYFYASDINNFMIGVYPNINNPPGTFPLKFMTGVHADSWCPRARRIAVVGNHLVCGDTLNQDGTQGEFVGPDYIQWSGHRNPEKWQPSLSTMADVQRLEGIGGRVQKIIGGTVGYIWQQNAIRLLSPEEGIGFRREVVTTKSGTNAPDSVIRYGKLFYYYGWDGFYVFDGASDPQSISDGKISDWFAKDADVSGLGSMKGMVDQKNGRLLWAYSTDSRKNVQGIPYNDSVLYYDIQTSRFSVVRLDSQILFEYFEKGYTVDDVDELFFDTPDSMDRYGYWQVDDDFFEANNLQVSSFNKDSEFESWIGEPMQAMVETGDISNDTSKRLYTNAVQPIVDGLEDESTMFIQIGKRNKLSETPTWTDVRQVSTRNQRACVRANSKFQRFRWLCTGSFKHAKALRLYGHSKGGING